MTASSAGLLASDCALPRGGAWIEFQTANCPDFNGKKALVTSTTSTPDHSVERFLWHLG
jgi:hypothetical protein